MEACVMSEDFSLERSRWYSLMKTGLACRNANACAQDVKKWAANLSKLEYEPTAGAALAEAEEQITEAMTAVHDARAEYERRTKQKAA